MKLKHTFLSLLLPLALATSASAGSSSKGAAVVEPAPAPAGGPYIGVAGGVLFVQDVTLGPVDAEFDTGFSVIGTIGYALGNGLAVELEGGYAEADIDNVDLGGFYSGDLDGDFKQVPIFANVVYNIDLNDRVALYIGAGAGAIYSEVDTALFGAQDDWSLALQAKAGVSFAVTEAVSLNLGYRFLAGIDGISYAVGPYSAEDDVFSHVAEIGLTIRF